MPSDWTYHASISTTDRVIFNHAIKRLNASNYHPIVCAKQMADGLNYRFLCIAKPTDSDSEHAFTIIAIHKPFDEDGYVTAIHPV